MALTWSLLPKTYPHLSPPELASLVRVVGLDTTNVIIRDGFPVRRESLQADLPPFLRAMRTEGVDVQFATADFTPSQILEDLLRVLGEEGITEFRMAHFPLKSPDVREALAVARSALEQIVPLCADRGVRAVYQVHHNSLIASASAAWALVSGLPAEWVGVELDPGNQSFEGYEAWERSCGLLREYVVASGIKDTRVWRDLERAKDGDKGWRREWCLLEEGVTNWRMFVRALFQIDFGGTFVLMPFYDPEAPTVVTRKLARDVMYLRAIVGEVYAQKQESMKPD